MSKRRGLALMCAAMAAGSTLAAAPAAASPGQPGPVGRDAHSVAGGDVIVTGDGDAEGYHLYVAGPREKWQWRSLASIQPAGYNDERWIGQQCVTGDGRYVVVVVAPWHASNSAAGLDHGGIAYAVEIGTGVVRPVAAGVSIAYFNPGCGLDNRAALTRISDDERSTQILLIDGSSGRITSSVSRPGQVTSAVPGAEGSVIAVRDDKVVAIKGSSERVLTRVPGQAFHLTTNASSGVDFLVAEHGNTTSVWHGDGRGARRIGAGRLGTVGLYGGRSGRNTAVGATASVSRPGLRLLPTLPTRPDTLSVDGAVATSGTDGSPDVGRLGTKGGPAASAALTYLSDRTVRHVPLPPVTTAVATAVPPLDRYAVTMFHTNSAQPAGPRLATTDFVSPCAVKRNDPKIQVRQPTTTEVNWAVQQAARGALSGAAGGRPAGAFNLDLPAYDPSADFPRSQLAGGGDIPREVLSAILVQESNWSQASWHALPGVAGNPLIADYYGSNGGTLAGVQPPDCGYGIGQITDGMRTVDGMDPALQRKVAVDYAENIAASAKILADKWNQLATAGITLNGTDPNQLENWYFSIWAYNTGLHPDNGDGVWGLGWVNNPMNNLYLPDRGKFMVDDSGNPRFDDASHPASWTYPERIFGWMQVPLQDGNGNRYAKSAALSYPDRTAFCDASDSCDPTNNAAPCKAAGSVCWWHQATNAICGGGAHSNACQTGTWDVAASAPEPDWPSQYRPCGENAVLPVPEGAVPGLPKYVLDQPQADNVVGCDPHEVTNGGTFTIAPVSGYGSDMDLHQISAGFGGHEWFTHDDLSTPDWWLKGTWKPNNLAFGAYAISVYVPEAGATADATYQVDNGGGWVRASPVIHQNDVAGWTSIGTYYLGPGASISLDNIGSDDGKDLAFSSIALFPIKKGPCFGATCQGLSPSVQGCDATQGVVTLDSTGGGLGKAELRYAPVCDAAWLKFTPYTSGSGATDMHTWNCDPNAPDCPDQPVIATASDPWSDMVDFHRRMQLDGSTDKFGGPDTQIN